MVPFRTRGFCDVRVLLAPQSSPRCVCAQLFSALILDRAVPSHGTGFNAAHNDAANKIMGLNQVPLSALRRCPALRIPFPCSVLVVRCAMRDARCAVRGARSSVLVPVSVRRRDVGERPACCPWRPCSSFLSPGGSLGCRDRRRDGQRRDLRRRWHRHQHLCRREPPVRRACPAPAQLRRCPLPLNIVRQILGW